MRRFAELGQSYRRSIEEAEIERDKARAQLQQWVDSLAPHVASQRDIPTGDLKLMVVVERRLMQSAAPQRELLQAVRDSIMRQLVDADRDYRGDLRQTDAQRMLLV